MLNAVFSLMTNFSMSGKKELWTDEFQFNLSFVPSDLTLESNYPVFFISNTFVRNARLKLAKKLSKF